MARIGRPPTCSCGVCRKCKQRIYMRNWWNRLTPEQRREKVAARDPERVREQDRLKMARRRKQGTPEQRQRIKVYDAVTKAKLRGELVPEPCERCGSELQIHAHHDDYSKPLEVRWLCRDCHEQHHAEAKAA